MFMRPLLFTYRRCPYAMRARMALLVAGVAFDAHEIVLRDKPGSMLAISPKGTVPVLQLPCGRVLEESWEIVEWALTREGAGADAQEWWGRAQTPHNLELLRRNDTDFKHHLDRYKYPERFEADVGADTLPEARRRHRDQAAALLLEPMERQLAHGRHLGGERPCATDIGIFPFVRQFAAVDPDWFASLPLDRVQHWLSTWQHNPLFQAAMHKLPSNQPIVFPGFDTAGPILGAP